MMYLHEHKVFVIRTFDGAILSSVFGMHKPTIPQLVPIELQQY